MTGWRLRAIARLLLLPGLGLPLSRWLARRLARGLRSEGEAEPLYMPKP
jgi:hypothetical protein